MSNPSRGEIWLIDLNPTRGHEQEGEKRPCLIVSANGLNRSAAGLVIIAPLTKTDRKIPSHIQIDTSQSGLNFTSFIMCDQIRSASKDRLHHRIGKQVPGKIMEQVEDVLKMLLSIR